jgi:hypothetical protein
MELANAMRMIGNLPLVLDQYPSGKWGFVGRVPFPLKYAKLDGSAITEAETAEILRSDSPARTAKYLGIKTLAWDTREQAERAAAEIGAMINQTLTRNGAR